MKLHDFDKIFCFHDVPVERLEYFKEQHQYLIDCDLFDCEGENIIGRKIVFSSVKSVITDDESDLDFGKNGTFEGYGKKFIGNGSDGSEIVKLVILELDEDGYTICVSNIVIEASDVEIM